jgi:hypothetical protein
MHDMIAAQADDSLLRRAAGSALHRFDQVTIAFPALLNIAQTVPIAVDPRR